MSVGASPSRQILLVDDEPSITLMLATFLRLEGYHAVVENDSTKAMSHIETEQFPIVIVDLMMPKKSGLELLREIKQYNSSIQVIVLTGHRSAALIEQCYRGGAEFIILKPMTNFPEFSQVVTGCFARYRKWVDTINSMRRMPDMPALEEAVPAGAHSSEA